MARADRYSTDVEVENKAEEQASNERLALLIAPVVLLTGASYYFIGHNYIGGALAGLALGLSLYGVPTKRKTHDAYFQVKEWSRPLWLRLISLILAGAGAYYWAFKTPEHVEHSGHLIAAGASLAIAILWAGWGSWRDMHASYKERQERRRPKTPDEEALYRFTPDTLRSAGLTSTSDIAQKELVPEVLEKDLDEKGRARVRVAVLPGKQSHENYERAVENIASAWGVPRVIVEQGAPRQNGAHTVSITAVLEESTVKGIVPFTPIPSSGMDVVEYVSELLMGKYSETADDYFINLKERNFVFSGRPGSGKSSFANALLGHLTQHPDIRVAFIDMKNGVEAAAWAPGINKVVHNGAGGAGIPGVLQFISQAMDDMAARYSRMSDAGVKNAWERDAQGKTFLGPREPLKILIVDECSELFKTDTPQQARDAALVISQLQSFVQQGRAAGYVLLISTQYPTFQSLPTVIRENASDSMCFKMKTDRGVSAALGSNFVIAGGLDPTKMGIGECILVNDDWVDGTRVKMALIDSQQIAQVVEDSKIAGKPWLQSKKKKAPAVQQVQLAKAPAQYPVPQPEKVPMKWTV